ncbi:MAG: hypothetical protein ACI8WM_002288 [Burkholderiaceae bacterium]
MGITYRWPQISRDVWHEKIVRWRLVSLDCALPSSAFSRAWASAVGSSRCAISSLRRCTHCVPICVQLVELPMPIVGLPLELDEVSLADAGRRLRKRRSIHIRMRCRETVQNHALSVQISDATDIVLFQEGALIFPGGRQLLDQSSTVSLEETKNRFIEYLLAELLWLTAENRLP